MFSKNQKQHSQLILMDSEELQELVRDLMTVRDSFLKISEETQLPALLRTAEVKKLLKIGDSSLAGLRQNGSIPFTKVGGTIYYLKKDILNLIINNYSSTYDN